MGNESEPKPTQQQIDQQAEEQIIADWLEHAEKEPKERLQNFLKHAVGWLRENKPLYEEKKARYETRLKQSKRNPSVPIGPADPFVVNYERAQELAEAVRKILTPGHELTPDSIERLFATNELLREKLSADVKSMINTLWVRTIFPDFAMTSEVVIEGIRYYHFANGIHRLTVYPSGGIEVQSFNPEVNGFEPSTRYLPPFPRASIQEFQWRTDKPTPTPQARA